MFVAAMDVLALFFRHSRLAGNCSCVATISTVHGGHAGMTSNRLIGIERFWVNARAISVSAIEGDQ
jgi:hypothetical protein